MSRNIALWTAAALILAADSGAASAHVSAEHLGGLAAGFAHPLSGLDHLAAALMTGLIAARYAAAGTARGWQPIVAFLAALALGIAAGAAFGAIAQAEVAVLASLPLLATILVFGRRLAPRYLLPLLAIFALAHGYAHGSEIEPGASGLRFAVGALGANTLLIMIGRAAGRFARSGRSADVRAGPSA